MASWPASITPIKAGDPVSASIVNRPLGQLDSRTSYLKTIVENLTTNEFTYVANVAVAPSTKAGNLVYWDAANRRYDKCLAAWDSSTTDQWGALVPSATAVFAGLLATKFTSTTGSLILGGLVRGFDQLTELFGSASPTAGTYYMSDATAGRVTATAPALGIMALQYLGEGDLLIPSVRFEHSTHDHKKLTLDKDYWLAANTTNFPNYDIPAGALWGYNRTAAGQEAVNAAFAMYPGIAVFTNKDTAANIDYDLTILNKDDIWWTDASAPTVDLYMWLTAPNSHGPGIVRSIATETPLELAVSLENGAAAVNAVPWTETENQTGATVVKSIADKTFTSGLVVEQIQAGTGISVSPSSGKGTVVVSATGGDGIIEAETVYMDNAMQALVDDTPYMVFPANRASSMICVAPLPAWSSGSKKIGIVVWMRGTSGGVLPIPALTAHTQVFPAATAAGAAIGATGSHTIAGIASSEYGKIYLMETATGDRISVTSGGLVRFKLYLNNASGSENYRALKLAIRLVTV